MIAKGVGMSNLLSLNQFMDSVKYTVKIEITNDEDDTVATTEIELGATPAYQYLVNTDDVIEWLGSMERGVFESDIKTRYEEYLESENGNG